MPTSSESQGGQNSPSAGLSPFYQSQIQSEQTSGRQSRRKGKNVTSRDAGGAKQISASYSNELGQSPPPVGAQSIGSQLPTGFPSGDKAITSPVLDALGPANTFQESENVSRTNAWARNVPFGKSPPNDFLDGPGISESPPNNPRHHDRPRVPSATPPSSPPVAKARPVSLGNGFNSIPQARQPVADRTQRGSLGTHYYPQPPLPHMPQPHFFRAPDIDLGALRNHGGLLPAEASPSFIGLDDLTDLPTKSGRYCDKVALIGSEGRLDVLAIEDDKVRSVGSVEGLNGTVVDAKLLPSNSCNDLLSHARPLIALIIHGPEVELNGAARPSEGVPSSDGASDHSEILPGLPNFTSSTGVAKTVGGVPSFQTRVEVYSLGTQSYVTTLLVTQPAPMLPNFGGMAPTPPSPIGDLKLQASRSYLIASSGTSGEVFIFGVSAASPAFFECLGKTWTSTQAREHRRYSNSSNSTDADTSPADSQRGHIGTESPIVTLCDRWLAVAPPMSPVRTSIRATIPESVILRRAPGLDSHTASSPPSVTCGVDTPDEESLLNRVARGVAQEFVKGARWIGDQGFQTWNNYWNKDTIPPNQAAGTRRTTLSPERQQPFQYFPPTHAPDTSTAASGDPEFVSLIDLKRLQDSHGSKSSGAVLPFATFQPPGGCSFISFAPSGLSILTASKKGDVQYVWDLMQVAKCRATLLLAEGPENVESNTTSLAPRVRQVARYSRLTTSSIVDVIWSSPMGEKLAIITRNGTVHLFDLPTTAFQWPPLRRIPRSVAPPATEAGAGRPNTADNNETAVGPFASAYKLVTKTQPILANLRGRTPSVGNTFSGAGGVGIASATGIRGGRAVAAGLSKSVGAATGTVQTLRHAGDNRVRISGLARNSIPSRATWLGSKDRPIIVAVDGESLKLFKVRRSIGANSRTKQRSVFVDGRAIEARLPSLSHLSTLATRTQSDEIGHFETEGSITGFWSITPAAGGGPASNRTKSHPLSQAEIETNLPYQPFHSDRRVNLFVYPSIADSVIYRQENSDAWVFGNDIPGTKLNLRNPTEADETAEDGSLLPSAAPGAVENLISIGDTHALDENAMEEIVITSRRRKLAAPSASTTGLVDDDGFFEDDCEVLDFAGDRV